MGHLERKIVVAIQEVIAKSIPKMTKAMAQAHHSYSVPLREAAEAFKKADADHVLPGHHTHAPAHVSSPGGKGPHGSGDVVAAKAATKPGLGVLSTPSANGVSRLVPGGGLAAHEAAGGHALARHLGMTDADLLARLASNPGISGASTFSSRAVAESSVAGLLDANGAGVGSWLAGSGSKLVLNGSLGVTGRFVAQGSSSVSNVTGVRAVLVRDPNLSVGYRLQTAFPTP